MNPVTLNSDGVSHKNRDEEVRMNIPAACKEIDLQGEPEAYRDCMSIETSTPHMSQTRTLRAPGGNVYQNEVRPISDCYSGSFYVDQEGVAKQCAHALGIITECTHEAQYGSLRSGVYGWKIEMTEACVPVLPKLRTIPVDSAPPSSVQQTRNSELHEPFGTGCSMSAQPKPFIRISPTDTTWAPMWRGLLDGFSLAIENTMRMR